MTVRSFRDSSEISPHCDVVATFTESMDWRAIFERRWESASATNILAVTANPERWQVILELHEGFLAPEKVGEFIIAGGSVLIPSCPSSVATPEKLLLEILKGYDVGLQSITRVVTDVVEIGCVEGIATLDSIEDRTVDLRIQVPNPVVCEIFDELEGVGIELEG